MSIFNSLGSNYNLQFVLDTLFSKKDENSKKELTQFLEEKYKGKVTLIYKGREALELGLKSINLPLDSFVAINGFTCFAVFDAIKKAGLNIEYLDIEKGELNFSPETLEKAIKKNPKIKAVIIQNTLGYPCAIKKIAKICKKEKLILAEDLAHSVGTIYQSGEEAGLLGDQVILSFSQDKMIDAVSGGALITKESLSISQGVYSAHPQGVQILNRLYPLFTYIIRNIYSFGLGKIIHFLLKNLKLLSEPMNGGDGIHELPNWAGKLALLQFKNLNDNLNHRKIIASIYTKLINPKILSPKIIDQIPLSSNLRFPIFVDHREALIQYLAGHNIFVSDIWYDAPIAPRKYLTKTDYRGQCPNAQLASEEILNLPTHINVSENDAEKIADAVNQWLKLK